jgi:hypothetical protein
MYLLLEIEREREKELNYVKENINRETNSYMAFNKEATQKKK